jgi:hypothetical protein
VDEFSPDGRLITRITSGGALNAPWGLAIAPAGWGRAAGSLLIGNFGDGRINIVARHGHHFAHPVTGLVRVTSTGRPFAEPGLWGLLPGTAANGGTDALWFTAGEAISAGPAGRLTRASPGDPCRGGEAEANRETGLEKDHGSGRHERNAATDPAGPTGRLAARHRTGGCPAGGEHAKHLNRRSGPTARRRAANHRQEEKPDGRSLRRAHP